MNEKQEADSGHVIVTTDATFQIDVFERSKQVPVVVDFWATWCAPCRMLGPVLESLAAEYQGRFVLVKAETEQNGGAAGSFGVSSIPAVYGVVGEEIVDGFVGALSENQIRGWLDRLIQSAETVNLIQLAETNPTVVISKLEELSAKAPNDSTLRIALAKAHLGAGNADACRTIVAELEKRGFLEPEAETLKAKLELSGMKAERIDELEVTAKSNPSDLSVQLKYGEALAASQRYEESLACLLAVVQKDRRGVGEQARQVMVDIFRVLPGDLPLVGTYRRKLASALY